MALKNPINFFRTTETDALKKKGITVGDTSIATTSVTFVDSPDVSTLDKISANDANGGGAIYIEGKKAIQGVSVLEKQYLWNQLATTEKAKYSAKSVTVSPSSGSYGFDTGAIDVTFTFEADYNGTGTTKVTSQTIGGTAGTAVTGKTGQYSKVISCPASTDGSQSVSTTFSFTYDNTGYGSVTKTATASFARYAKSVIISTAAGTKPTQATITAATSTYTSISAMTEYKTTAGQDMWICTPNYVKYTGVTVGGFECPFDAAIQVTVNGITYNCRRKSDTPTAETGTIVKMIVK